MSATSTPSANSFPPGYLAENRGYQLTAVAIAFIAIEILLVALRFSARRMHVSPMGWDDWLIIPALISNVGTCILGLSQYFSLFISSDGKLRVSQSWCALQVLADTWRTLN